VFGDQTAKITILLWECKMVMICNAMQVRLNGSYKIRCLLVQIKYFIILYFESLSMCIAVFPEQCFYLLMYIFIVTHS